MDIVIIGTGNVAQVLARLAHQAGHRILQVVGRDPEKTRSLAAECGAQAKKGYAGLAPADLYLIAVTDSAIPKLARRIHLSQGIIAHTAGSVSASVLEPCGVPYGVLWPLQSIRANLDRIPAIPFVVEGKDEPTRERLAAFAGTLSGTVGHADGQQRRELHLAAVYTSNFMNHLMAQVQGYCREHGLDFGLLRPLLTETVNRTSEAPAAELQTGPAVRGDKATIKLHKEMLRAHPEMLAMYKMFTRSISGTRL